MAAVAGERIWPTPRPWLPHCNMVLLTTCVARDHNTDDTRHGESTACSSTLSKAATNGWVVLCAPCLCRRSPSRRSSVTTRRPLAAASCRPPECCCRHHPLATSRPCAAPHARVKPSRHCPPSQRQTAALRAPRPRHGQHRRRRCSRLPMPAAVTLQKPPVTRWRSLIDWWGTWRSGPRCWRRGSVSRSWKRS